MRTAWNKRSKEQIIEIIENLGYIYLDDYFIDRKHRKVIIQDKDGYRYNAYLDHILEKGRGLRFVDISNPFSLENISLWLKTQNSSFVLLENNEYKGSKIKLNLYCNKCKDYPKMTWGDILSANGCGICDGKQTGIYNNLFVHRPDIAKEWHPTLNKSLTPQDFTYGSEKKVWWLCPNGHEYFSRIANRTNGEGCKKCSDKNKESKIAMELKDYILNKYPSKEEYPIFINPETGRPLPFDIYIFGGKDPTINGIYIEVHWYHHYEITKWHKQQSRKNKNSPEEEFEYQKHKDKIKKNFAKKNGTYIEIDLRKIKTLECAINHVENILSKTLFL